MNLSTYLLTAILIKGHYALHIVSKGKSFFTEWSIYNETGHDVFHINSKCFLYNTISVISFQIFDGVVSS